MEQDEINEFDWYYKRKFVKNKLISGNTEGERETFLSGTDDLYNMIVVKKFCKCNNNNNNSSNKNSKSIKILQEIYFLACSKKNGYFVEIIDTFFSKDNNHLFIIFRAEGSDLYDIINSDDDYRKKYPNFPRLITFQIVCGLKFLHEKNLSHNDIKPKNIIIPGRAKVKICDMGSTSKISTIKYGGTNGYSSPQALLGKVRTKEDDMWSVGVVFLELLKKETGIFEIKINENIKEREMINEEILKYLLENFYDIKIPYYDWNNNINYNLIKNWIKQGSYDIFESKLKSNLLADINKEDRDLIENLLQINPAKRMNADNFLKLPLFEGLKIKDFEFNYSDDDYNKYFVVNKPKNFEDFKKYHEEIKEKFIGISIFDEDTDLN